jgi:aminobenzoyl-glutamate transport protein
MDKQVPASNSRLDRLLGAVERIGNKLPDPALLFVALLLIVWALSWALAGVDFGLAGSR